MFCKAAAAMMAEELRRRYPGRYDLPSEVEVQGFISAETASRGSRSERSEPRRQSNKMSRQYLHHLTLAFCESNGTMKPKEAVVLLKSVGDITADDFPSEKQIKSKLAAMKAAYKKSKRLPDVPDLY